MSLSERIASADLLAAPSVTRDEAAQMLGVTRERIRQLVDAGRLRQVPLRRPYAVVLADVERQVALRGLPEIVISSQVRCDACGQPTRAPSGIHPRCRVPIIELRRECATPGCVTKVNTAYDRCARCRAGNAPTQTRRAYETWGRYKGHECSRCGGDTSPQRAKSCLLRDAPIVCINCEDSNSLLARLRSRGRVNGIIPGARSDRAGASA